MSKEPKRITIVSPGSENVSDQDGVGVLVGFVFIVITIWSFFHYNLLSSSFGRFAVIPASCLSGWFGFRFGYDSLTAAFILAVLAGLYFWIF